MELAIDSFWQSTGFANMTWQQMVMVAVAGVLLYLAIKKKYETLLLIPISFGVIMVNLPLTGIMAPPQGGEVGGLLYYLYQGTSLGIYPPLIFIGVGAWTDFGPLLANPKTMLLGAAAQFGIFTTILGALAVGFQPFQAGAIGIIGGADGPTAIFTAANLAPELLGPISVAAYSYMALVPVIQPPIIKLLTNDTERKVRMGQLREVSQKEKIIFPVAVTILTGLLIPASIPLIGSLMFGNLLKESGVVDRLLQTARDSLVNIVTIFLGLTVGATATAENFLVWETIQIILLGLFAFSVGTFSGVVLGKIMYRLTGGKINPLIGSAGVSAVPMAARVSQKLGLEADGDNHLLMHAMGPNVAGVIGSAVAAGVILSHFG